MRCRSARAPARPCSSSPSAPARAARSDSAAVEVLAQRLDVDVENAGLGECAVGQHAHLPARVALRLQPQLVQRDLIAPPSRSLRSGSTLMSRMRALVNALSVSTRTCPPV